jgi:hypothetical protein
MNRKSVKTRIILVLMVILSTVTFSCRKETPTVAIITVVDVNGEVFPNATVRLFPVPTIASNPTIIIDNEVLSDVSGAATFDYTDKYNLGQAGFAILNIQVSDGQTLFGEGIIKVEAEKYSYETIVIQPQ